MQWIWKEEKPDASDETSDPGSARKTAILAVSGPDPSYQLTQFNLEKDASKFDWIGKVMNATDPDLSRFRERGGKLLMYFGWADPR